MSRLCFRRSPPMRQQRHQANRRKDGLFPGVEHDPPSPQAAAARQREGHQAGHGAIGPVLVNKRLL